MQVVQAPRASAIIYNLLVQHGNRDPWLLPANICPIVPITFLKARVPFKFVDISAGTLHMDLEQAEALVRKRRFGGLLYAHTYGEASTPNEFFKTIKKFSPEFRIIDDRCLCVPDLEADVADEADIVLYSTGYAKIVELNFGGYAFLRDDMLYQSAPVSFDQKQLEEIETSYKEAVRQRAKFVYCDCDWLDAASPTLPWCEYQGQIEVELKKSLDQRARLNEVYAATLPPGIQLPAGFQTWRFNIRVENKQLLLEKIFSSGLFASSHYASLANIMADDRAPQAETLAGQVLNLFNDHHFTLAQAEQVCKIILEHLP